MGRQAAQSQPRQQALPLEPLQVGRGSLFRIWGFEDFDAVEAGLRGHAMQSSIFTTESSLKCQ